MLENNLIWLIEWYNSLSDAISENNDGIEIVNLGNPWWTIRINIENTDLQYKEFKKISIDRSENDWLFCKVENSLYDAACGTFNILEGFQVFRNWAGNTFHIDKGNVLEENFIWLVNWFDSQCDGYWEGSTRIHIITQQNASWNISINIEETELEDKDFPSISIKRSQSDWLICEIQDGFFEGQCGSVNFGEALQIFKAWAEN